MTSSLLSLGLFSARTFLFSRSFTQSCTNFKKKKRLRLVPPLNESDLVEQFVRGSGPGGQAVNKTNNAVSLIHQPTGIRVQAHTHRSREANRNQARRVLAERVDYFLNRGQSQIEKEWKREQRRKIKKIQKRRKKEREQEEEKNKALQMKNGLGGRSDMIIGSDQDKRKRFNSLHKNTKHAPIRSIISRKLPVSSQPVKQNTNEHGEKENKKGSSHNQMNPTSSNNLMIQSDQNTRKVFNPNYQVNHAPISSFIPRKFHT